MQAMEALYGSNLEPQASRRYRGGSEHSNNLDTVLRLIPNMAAIFAFAQPSR
jgi:hypothetical protein